MTDFAPFSDYLSDEMLVLAGDVGGTKTALATAEVGPRSVRFRRVRRYRSLDWPGLEAMVDQFFENETARPRAAVFGVPGPVRDGRAKLARLPWSVDARSVAAGLRPARVTLVNDFVAAALGLPRLSPRRVAPLLPGRPDPDGPIGVLGAGTGLGQAALVPREGGYFVLPSEGGHVELGVRDEREERLVAFLRRRHGRASRDRILSGEGLGNLYDFLANEQGRPDPPALARAFATEDRATAISRFALSGRDPVCREALSLFVSIYGSEAANVALQYQATGGVYLAGGIAPKILPALRRRIFRESFRAKPPMEEFLATIPVRVVLDPRLALLGAALEAYRITIETTRRRSKTTARRRSR
ncbi:MAG TPA: glucokinase [Thermoanaerobaculia bacterium]|nr:glucokinase [Thermoanaerobaculia bacterium]